MDWRPFSLASQILKKLWENNLKKGGRKVETKQFAQWSAAQFQNRLSFIPSTENRETAKTIHLHFVESFFLSMATMENWFENSVDNEIICFH